MRWRLTSTTRWRMTTVATTSDDSYDGNQVRRGPTQRMSIDAEGRAWLARIQAGRPRCWWERRLWPLLRWLKHWSNRL